MIWRHVGIVLLVLAAVGTAVAEDSGKPFEAVVQRLVQAINAQDFAAARQDFNQAVSDDLTLEKTEKVFTDILAGHGKIEKLDTPRVTTLNQAVFSAHCARNDLRILVVLDEQDKIGGLWFMPPVPPVGEVLQRLVKAINGEDYVAARLDFTQAMLDDLSIEKSVLLFPGMVSHYGKIEKLDPPRAMGPNRIAVRAHGAVHDLDLRIALDEQNKIASLTFGEAIPVPEQLVTSYRLPVEGEWLVLLGGDTKELNGHHHDSPVECFAFDLTMVNDKGLPFRGNGLENEDYYAFEQPILAPADGVVTDVISGVRDNRPGTINTSCACGNMVIIRHREHEVSALGHLQQGSIRVKCGDQVKQGQVVGLCGNSGCSTGPHLHFQLQNTPLLQEATGMRCVFEKVLVTRDGKSETQTGYSPLKGDLVSQP